ncbi:hypothetical protein JZ751_023884 [Albula glossodonta]|uniref:Kazal-like domain-containing protein n=1 Tax=Albula glossodonta TaxID=121402 RepID=A0A8T2NP37_9TELE|nr:hypothetical protein JZ751_023884 [Albula glossodonta]
MQSVTRLVLLFCVAALLRGAFVNGAREANCASFPLPACPRDFRPVCGDDGNTYDNECMLCVHNLENEANVAVAYNGPCQS